MPGRADATGAPIPVFHARLPPAPCAPPEGDWRPPACPPIWHGRMSSLAYWGHRGRAVVSVEHVPRRSTRRGLSWVAVHGGRGAKSARSHELWLSARTSGIGRRAWNAYNGRSARLRAPVNGYITGISRNIPPEYLPMARGSPPPALRPSARSCPTAVLTGSLPHPRPLDSRPGRPPASPPAARRSWPSARPSAPCSASSGPATSRGPSGRSPGPPDRGTP